MKSTWCKYSKSTLYIYKINNVHTSSNLVPRAIYLLHCCLVLNDVNIHSFMAFTAVPHIIFVVTMAHETVEKLYFFTYFTLFLSNDSLITRLPLITLFVPLLFLPGLSVTLNTCLISLVAKLPMESPLWF